MALTRLGLNQSINLASNVTGALPVANGGTALTSGFVNGGGLTEASVRPPPLTKPEVSAVPPFATGNAPVTLLAKLID